MESPPPSRTADRRRPDRRWILWLLLIWLAAAAGMLWFRWTGIRFLSLLDTDDNLRFAQVRDWLAGQSWWDLRQHHLDPPAGANIHWSRLVDLPIAGLILLIRPWAGALEASRWAAALAPLLPMAVAMLGAALAVRRLVEPRAWAAGAAFALCGQSALFMWMPLRIDHHGWQLAFLILSVAGVADPRRARGGVTVGLAGAASLTVGLEMLPYLGLAALVLVGRWIADRADARRLAAYGAATALGVGVGYLGFASNDNRLAVCDALSPVWLSVALLGGAGAVALAALPVADWRRRLLLAAVLGVGLALFFALAYPRCLARPEGASPELVKLWLGNVREAKPITMHPWRTGVTLAGLPVAGLIGGLMALRRTWRTALFLPWAATFAMAVAAAAMLFWQMRTGPAAQLLAVPGAAALAAWLLVPLRASRSFAVRVLGPVLLLIFASGVWTQFAVSAFPAKNEPKDTPGLAAGEKNRSRLCATLPALRPVAKLPPATFLAFVDFSPRLIAMTHHSAIAGPYHRNGAAILDVHHAFRGSEAVAHEVVRRHGARYVLTCPGFAESTLYATQAKRGFYMQLQAGRIPAWLRPVPLPKGNPLRLWQVVG